MKALFWFVVGLGTGEFVLRWVIHAIYIAIIVSLILGPHLLGIWRP